MELFLTILVAFSGGYLGLRARLPAGALVGAMLATALLSVTSGMAYMPTGLKFYTQIATGAYVGAKISKSDAWNLRHIAKPAVILSAVMLAFTVGVGWIICHMSELSVATAMFSMAPAGIADMTLASMDFDAQPAVVALIQTLRVIFTILLLPPFIKLVARRQRGTADRQEPDRQEPRPGKGLRNLGITLLIALLCGWLGNVLGVPGGTIAFSMAGCAAYNIISGKGYMPLRLRQFVQVFAGALTGCTVSRAQILQMAELYQVVILAVVSFIALDLAAAWLIAKWTDMDLISALFACAPGGLTDMALIAEDMGADSVKVAGMHMLRLVSVIAFYPSIIRLLTTALH